ncbi:hypothetical protein SNOG_12600 [Parastagonospora nodorum SN15]|uniref:DUF6594 domain-containing protein n=1 Tax=Phaeosphaeria nodorum (strain SN15 / ATCC MYA-4574 / FGSC 10173) TaxID=321614 RepID=Q0U6L4_PHANO|nr:hypothetical protein SNOG_12600 [Parastagonospora nodorum SN15]EAT79898.1 hypothetical protein SNOG_12600 [Parastagonospora nodorum SN15]
MSTSSPVSTITRSSRGREMRLPATHKAAAVMLPTWTVEPPHSVGKEMCSDLVHHPNRSVSFRLKKFIQDYPMGYPRQAAFQSSEPSWSIYRAFDYLHSRVILDLQEDLRSLETKLVSLDEIDVERGDGNRVTSRKDDLERAREDNVESKRASLLSTIRGKLVSYDELLGKARELNAFQRPSKRDYRSFRTWFYNNNPLSYVAEEEFIRRKEDLITLRHGREWSGFDGFVESCVRAMHGPLTVKLFTTQELRKKTNDPDIRYYSQSRIEKLVGLIITLIIFILLVLPVVAMYKLTSVGDRNSTFDAVGILVVFTLLFSAAMSLVTKAKRHELFAASAAYCAVLVVFISNFSNDNNNIGRVQ